MKIMQLSKRKGETGGAPRQTKIMGQPHMLAYINEAERQMLKRAGGSELPGPEGIPSYLSWNDIKQAASDTWNEITSGGAAQTETYNGGSSRNANEQAAKSMQSVGVTSLSGHSTDNDKTNNSNSISNSDYTIPEDQRAVIPTTQDQGVRQDAVDKILVEKHGWTMGPKGDAISPAQAAALPQTSISIENANKGMAESMLGTGVLNTGGKLVPPEPYNAGNPPIMEYDGSTGQYTVVGGLDPNKPIEMATNEDGTYYQANNNPANVQNTLATALGVQTGNTSGMVVNDGNGGYVTTGGDAVDGGYDLTGGTSNDTAGDNSTTTTTTPVVVDDTPSTPAAPPVNQALVDALARRDAALSTQMGNVETAFGFSNDDYYTGLGESYREGGLSEAFTTAYDDATRGIYDTFKSAGMLTQQGVDDSMGILASAEGGEEGRIDGIVNQYTTANRNFVTGGRTGMEGTLSGFATDTQDIPTIDAETAQIMGYDVAGNSQQFKTPKEQEVVDFFTDFVKRSYDPSYNVDPTAVASGGPSRVSGSVDQLGAGTQPSTIAGILDPIAGGSVKVIG